MATLRLPADGFCLLRSNVVADAWSLRRDRETDRQMRPLTEALALVGGAVDVDLGADNVAERQEHLRQFGVAELLRQMVDEQVAAFRTDWRRRSRVHGSWQIVTRNFSSLKQTNQKSKLVGWLIRLFQHERRHIAPLEE